MASTVLAIVQAVCRKMGLAVPTALVASTNADELQLLEILASTGEYIRQRSSWEILRRRATWTSTGVESQGLIRQRCSEDFEYIVPETFWALTTRKPVLGPLSDKDWQAMKAMVPSTPLYQYRIEKGEILVLGPAPISEEFSLIYKSFRWVETTTVSGVYQATITSDANASVFPDYIMKLGFEAMYKNQKKLDSSMMVPFETAIVNMGSRDSVQPVINMAGGTHNYQPGIFVPAGNWPITP